MHSLLIHFQVCKQVAFGELVCDNQIESYLKKRTFRLAMQSTTFDPNYQGDAEGDFEGEEMFRNEIYDGLIYPYVEGQTMRSNVLIEQGILKLN